MKIRNCMLLRGLYMLWKTYFGVTRSKLGYCADNVTITPPVQII